MSELSEDDAYLFGDLNFEPNAVKLHGSMKEKRQKLQEAIDDQIIGQRITAIELSRTKSDFSFKVEGGELIPAKQIELVLRFDNNVAYILRIEAVIKDMGEALANINGNEAAGS